MTETDSSASRLGLFKGILPVRSPRVFKDALAGLQLAAMNIPQALGYTKIAGMPIVTGFYTLLLPLLAFATFGSSRYLVVSADSATAAILAGGLGNLAPFASPQYVELAGIVAMLTAALLLLARFLRLGFLADFLSQTVLVGFLTGVGFQVGIAVVGEMLGIEVQAHRTISQLLEAFHKLSQAQPLALGLSVAVLVVVLGLHWLTPKVPGSLIAVVGATAASAVWDFARRGVPVVGPVSGGLPHLTFPSLTWQTVLTLLPVSTSCLVMIVAQSAATARYYAVRHHQRLDEDADLLGLSAANAAAALSGTFVVDGSPTQTAMVESSGGQSQLAQVSTAVVVALVLLFLTSPLQYLPRCVLGAIVFSIAVRLVDVRSLREIRRESPGEFLLALVTAAVVIVIGVEQGIVIAMVLSLLRIVKHSYRPLTGVMVPGENGLWELHPVGSGEITAPGIVLYRFGAALFYANVGRFTSEILDLTRQGSGKVRWLIVDAEAITNIDYTAARAVRELLKQLSQDHFRLAFARVAPTMRDDLVRHHVLDEIGPQFVFARLHEALAAAEEKINAFD